MNTYRTLSRAETEHCKWVFPIYVYSVIVVFDSGKSNFQNGPRHINLKCSTTFS